MIPSRLVPPLRAALVACATVFCLIPSSVASATNPFHRFFGEWTLKDDNWSHNWGNGTEHIKIPLHHTLCRAINTDNSLLAVIDGPPPHGHIFWAYNPTTREVLHLSSFGQSRTGTGQGLVTENGDVRLKVVFSDEAPGTYRLYTYRWISDDEYELRSVQHDQSGQPTGLFYAGTFVRTRSPTK